MWFIAILGAATSFVECTLAQIYKVKDGSRFRGGPAYYMEKGLNKRWMGVWFSLYYSCVRINFQLCTSKHSNNSI